MSPRGQAARTEGARSGYLLLHGWQNHRPEGHWHRWLYDELTTAGQRVEYPQLPHSDEPEPDRWVAAVAEALAALAGTRPIVVCHSLSCLAWLLLRTDRRYAAPRVDRLAFVAPPSPDVVRAIPEIAAFAPALPSGAEVWEGVDPGAGSGRLVFSDDDKYCPEGADRAYGGLLGLDQDRLSGEGHLDMDAGYGDWPSMLDWCLNGSVRIRPRADGGGSL